MPISRTGIVWARFHECRFIDAVRMRASAAGKHWDDESGQAGGRYSAARIAIPELFRVMFFTGQIQQEVTGYERGKMKKATWASAIALTAGILTSVPPAASAASPTANEVHNTGSYGIGAVRYVSHVHTPGHYDALIPAGLYSGWPHTSYLYVGPGYCVRLRGWLSGGGLTQVQILTPGGPTSGEWRLNDSYPGFDARALLLSDPGCSSSAKAEPSLARQA